MREKLLNLMKSEQLTASKLAELLGIQPSGISHILGGRNKPSFDLVVKILKVFPDLNPDWLLLDSDQIFREDAASPAVQPVSYDDGLPSSPVLPFDAVQNRDSSAVNSERKPELPPLFSTHKKSGDKQIERVIVLYSDRSFESYTEF